MLRVCLSFCHSVIAIVSVSVSVSLSSSIFFLSFCHSVILSFCHSVSVSAHQLSQPLSAWTTAYSPQPQGAQAAAVDGVSSVAPAAHPPCSAAQPQRTLCRDNVRHAVPCFRRRWDARLPRWAARKSHSSHPYGCSPVCTCMWLDRAPLLAPPYVHPGHAHPKGRSPVCVCACSVRLLF